MSHLLHVVSRTRRAVALARTVRGNQPLLPRIGGPRGRAVHAVWPRPLVQVDLWGPATRRTRHLAEITMKTLYVKPRWVLLISLALLAPGKGSGSTPAFEGIPNFAIFMQPAEYGAPHEPFRVLISMGGDYPSDVVGTGTLRLGPGLTLVNGELVHKGHVSFSWRGEVDRKWYLELRAVGPGRTEIRALLKVAVGNDRTDEMEMVLPIEVDEQSLHFGSARRARAETIRGGQRFRYGGEFLVPIDAPEEVSPTDIVEKPKAIVRDTAICEACPPAQVELPFVVLVGPDGGVRSSRLADGGREAAEATPAMIQSAQAALKRWKFTPGRTRLGPINDWVIVLVPVQGGGQPR